TELATAIQELQSTMSDLESSVESVRTSLDDFDGKNWAQSLAEVDDAVAQTESDLDDVLTALEDLASKARPGASGSVASLKKEPNASGSRTIQYRRAHPHLKSETGALTGWARSSPTS